MSRVYVAMLSEAVEKAGVATLGQTLSVKSLPASSKSHGKVAVTKANPRTKVKVVRGKRGPKKGLKATPRPCPVTGILNTYRRFSYLVPEVRTAANLKKYKGWAKNDAPTPAPVKVKPTQKVAAKKATKPKSKPTKNPVAAAPAPAPATPSEVTATVFHPSI
jgi:hypothetical protein